MPAICEFGRHLELHVCRGGIGPRYMLASCDLIAIWNLCVCTGGWGLRLMLTASHASRLRL